MILDMQGAQSSSFANLLQRSIAFVLDWLFSYFVMLPLVAVLNLARGFGGEDTNVPPSEIHESSIGDLWWVPIMAAVITGYFTFSWTHRQSLGMKATGIQVVDAATGTAPSIGQGVTKAFFTVAFGFSALLLLVSGFSDAPEGFNAVDLGVLYSAATVFVISIVGRLWLLRDPKRQSLFDKIAGLVVVKTASKTANV